MRQQMSPRDGPNSNWSPRRHPDCFFSSAGFVPLQQHAKGSRTFKGNKTHTYTTEKRGDFSWMVQMNYYLNVLFF